MPKATILVDIDSRTLGTDGPGPIRTCRRLSYTYRRDGAGDFRAEFPASDVMLKRVTLKNTYLLFRVGGVVVVRGLVERIQRSMSNKGKQLMVISGRDQLGALAENTIGDLLIDWENNAPAQILAASNVPNQVFTQHAEGYDTTILPWYKQFTGESALSALIKVAEGVGEHFRTPTDGSLEIVWMRQDTPPAPIRLLSSGGPLLHQNPDVAIIEQIEADQNGEQLANRIFPYGAGNGEARLTLADATMTMPAGYTLNAAQNTITNNAQQNLPSVRRAISKTFNEIGVIDDSIAYTIIPTADTLAGATTIPVGLIAMELPSGTLLDLNGLGVDFVELSTNVSIGANILNVVTTTFDVLAIDTLEYASGISAVNREIASNALAAAALAFLQRVSDPERMVAYSLTVRGLPDSVTVGMEIPVQSQASGFAIDDDLIILEITRTVDRNGRQPASLKVVPVDWFDQGEATDIARKFEELRTYQAQTQPVTYAQVSGVPGDFPPTAHAPTHQDGGSDEVATITPAAGGIPKALPTGYLDIDWIDPADLAAGSVASVNGATGVVVLDADDIDDTSTTNKFATAAELSKLAGIAAGAEVNVNADWTAVSGDAQILNKPTLATQYTDELAQDAVGAMFTGNVETDIAATYQDATAKIDLVVSPTLVGDRIHAATSKATPVAADEFGFWDSVASVLKKINVTQLIAWLTTLFVDLTTAQTVGGDKTFSKTVTVDIGALNGSGGVDVTGSHVSGQSAVTVSNTGGASASLKAYGTSVSAGLGGNTGFGAGACDIIIFADGNVTSGGTHAIRFRAGGYAANQERVTILSTGVGIGTTAPQGAMHIYDGVGSQMFVTKSAVAGTKVVIINGALAGDVTSCITCMYTLSNSDGSEMGGLFTLVNNGGTTTQVATVGGTTWTFSVLANGEFSVIRTAGADTAIIVMNLVWR